MRYLFVHRNAPAQYKHIISALASDPRNEVVVISQPNDRPIDGARRVYYTPKPADGAIHHHLRTTDEAMRFGHAVMEQARALKASGFTPDLMAGHNAWGETLFLKDVWPDTPLLSYFEFFYEPRGADSGFDPEFPASFDDFPRTRIMNTVNLLGLQAADWGHSPTFWQRDRYPALHQPQISVIHEGIDTDAIRPNHRRILQLPGGGTVTFGDEVITFVSRSLEPYRGFHVFMRALPEILRRRPNATVLVVGNDDVSYGSRLAGGVTFREALLKEQAGRIDLSRVHFLGWVPYEVHLAILQVSAVHLYLTYPFVLSWSMMEAMASGCLVVGSATPPVMEVIRDGDNGLLVDFFGTQHIADAVDRVLDDPTHMAPLRERARQTIIERYDLKRVCLPRFLSLFDNLAHRRRPASDTTPPGAHVITYSHSLNLAIQAERDGNTAQVAALCHRILRQRPVSVEAWMLLGRQRLGAGDAAGALEAFRCGMSLAPFHSVLMAGLAAALERLCRTEEAAGIRRRLERMGEV
ncbi:glycosyltransferase involved in cell wall biosynthesis [Azospirillum fermentarium]|uniref:glycosyltransferase n=1 Tax=Azospirillum fermentarium TaxID=1233114 RepID=UPI00222808FE|nr:glycosyltransferase [Azospirillum fermentarium]MCW2249482.1 glycosyltransferase involved in cell wall biosynthesis [Azospirillum fermentarium]